MANDRLKRNEDTGLVDREGIPIREGAILERWYNEWYGDVRSVVSWCPKKGAWIDRGRFESGNGWSSLNGEHFCNSLVVGHVDETPEELYPAVQRR